MSTIAADALEFAVVESEIVNEKADGDFLRRLTETGVYGFATRELHTAWPEMAHIHVSDNVMIAHTPAAVFSIHKEIEVHSGIYQIKELEGGYCLRRLPVPQQPFSIDWKDGTLPVRNAPALSVTAAKNLASVGAAMGLAQKEDGIYPVGYLLPTIPDDRLAGIYLYDPRYVTAALDHMGETLATIDENCLLYLSDQLGNYRAMIMPMRRGGN